VGCPSKAHPLQQDGVSVPPPTTWCIPNKTGDEYRSSVLIQECLVQQHPTHFTSSTSTPARSPHCKQFAKTFGNTRFVIRIRPRLIPASAPLHNGMTSSKTVNPANVATAREARAADSTAAATAYRNKSKRLSLTIQQIRGIPWRPHRRTFFDVRFDLPISGKVRPRKNVLSPMAGICSC
jgi:hypothetical protein